MGGSPGWQRQAATFTESSKHKQVGFTPQDGTLSPTGRNVGAKEPLDGAHGGLKALRGREGDI